MNNKTVSIIVKHILALVLLGSLSLTAQTPANKNASGKNITDPCFLVISDIHLDTRAGATAHRGEDAKNDLWEKAKTEITALLRARPGAPSPGFILLLGDMPLHKAPNETRAKSIMTVLAGLREIAVNSQIPLLYVPGNNDPVEGNYHPYTTATTALDNDTKAEGKYHWPVIEADRSRNYQTVLSNNGSYSTYPLGKVAGKTNLKVLVLNTIQFCDKGLPYDAGSAIALQEINWLTGELKKAAADGDSVIIAMHVPPGTWFPDPVCNGVSLRDTFLSLLHLYSKNVVAVLGSHTHLDGVGKLYYANQAQVNTLTSPYTLFISAPGISPDHMNNPAVKLVSYDRENFVLTNFTTCYYAGFNNGGSDSWTGRYDFKSMFHCKGLSTICKCLDGMPKDKLEMYQQNIRYVESDASGLGKESLYVEIYKDRN